MIKIKDEDSNIQASENKLNQLENNKKMLLERIINQKREAKLSSRGNSQNPSSLGRESDNENGGFSSQRKKSPFGKERQPKGEDVNESLPNLKSSFSN